ncbi:hypothetical protein I4I80_02105 [Pseudomonas syringae pv. tomato]|nr:hypothetical protein [Pseudomonas syringae pv. tomato]MBW8024882.1 hypothetical protein [Pseudomonas syringae pv. tomato]
MGQPTFADRYAEAGLVTTGPIINARGDSIKRVVADATPARVYDLIGAFYEIPETDLSWFRDEIGQDDPTFSLMTGAREARILAAIALGDLVGKGNSRAILGVNTAHVCGRVRPAQAEWLITDAKQALSNFSVSNRVPKKITTAIAVPAPAKALGEQLEGIEVSDWTGLLSGLGGLRAETHSLVKSNASLTTSALTELERQVKLMREETQMLWWIFGGHSRSLGRGFNGLDPHQAALVGAIDLANLTNYTHLGPIAAPAMLERVIASSKKPKAPSAKSLLATLESFDQADLESLDIRTELPPRITPVSIAIDLVRTLGKGAWHQRFKALTGIEASIEFEPISLAVQLYYEDLLGQLP